MGSTKRSPAQERSKAILVFAVTVLLWIAMSIAVNTVKEPATLTVSSANPTPYGYTLSLAFFALPLIAVSLWLPFGHTRIFCRDAFWRALLVLVPMGFFLDIFFGLLFFNFPNEGATLGIKLWAFDWDTRSFVRALPIEEFLFYSLGFGTILSSYVWFNEYFLAAYCPAPPLEHRKRLVHFDKWAFALGIALTVLAILYKKFGLHDYHDGFPGWMVFLIWAGILPAVGLFQSTRDHINWRALGITVALMTMVSIVWEVTLAIPYGWWGYEKDQMMGIFVRAWWGLPLEQPVLWVMISFATVIIYEAIFLYVHRRQMREPRDAGDECKSSEVATR